jgi:hypothetical protein
MMTMTEEAKSTMFLVWIAFMVGLFIGGFLATMQCRKEACEAGAARYVADPKTGATTFVYNTTTEGDSDGSGGN